MNLVLLDQWIYILVMDQRDLAAVSDFENIMLSLPVENAESQPIKVIAHDK